MRYDEAVRFLFRLESFGIKLGLDNIRRFAERLGHPENAFPAIHVAGTNGKGTVCAALAAVLTTAGYRTGLFTSPHLRDFRERMRIDGEKIPRREVARFVELHRRFITGNRITFFETTTAMAFDWFSRSRCDAAVVEVGMGGRLDATNILTPVLSVITAIDLDHTVQLGENRPRIAREKAGIIKPGIPVVCGPMALSARRTIAAVAVRRAAPLTDAEGFVRLRPAGDGKYKVEMGDRFPRQVRWAYPGNVHRENLKTAITALGRLRSLGFRLLDGELRRGLAATRWPGRFQVLPGRPVVIYDVAHNAAAAHALGELMADAAAGRFVAAVCAVADDKDWRRMIRHLKPHVDRWYFTRLPHSRSWRLGEVGQFAGEQGLSFVATRWPGQAFRRAKAEAPPDGILLIFGSHYLVGELIPPASIDPAPLATESSRFLAKCRPHGNPCLVLQRTRRTSTSRRKKWLTAGQVRNYLIEEPRREGDNDGATD